MTKLALLARVGLAVCALPLLLWMKAMAAVAAVAERLSEAAGRSFDRNEARVERLMGRAP